ncbi:MAG: lipid-A-disaccharide synthase [Elusimicrobiota bacterium]|jgi:lipid-A-disaccharide synthase|nr:lipid-A-disaccharide synthase [Elusimicrobiota bacterium]
MPQIIQNSKNILVVAGDVSGDVHASNLIKAIKAYAPEVSVTAMGGERMRAASDKFLYNLVSKGASGFVEPFKKIPLWLRLLKMVKKYINQQQPACAITIDFYGFNHQVLGLAKHRGVATYYSVCPQVWASRGYRAKTIVRLAKKMFVIFPFEKKIYTDLGGDAIFLGNPLLDTMPEPKPKTYQDGAQKDWKIGFLPGSRPGEIARHTRLFWDSFVEIKRRYPNATAHFFAVPEVSDAKLAELMGGRLPQGFNIVRENDFAARSDMDFVVTCSGTATLECALLGLPMIVVYKTNWITYQIAKLIIKVPYISLVNILSKKQVVKELIQKDAAVAAVAKEVCAVLSSEKAYCAMREKLLKIRQDLGEGGVAEKAAKIIIDEVFPGNNYGR